MKKEIVIDEGAFSMNGKRFETKRQTIASTTDDKFRKAYTGGKVRLADFYDAHERAEEINAVLEKVVLHDQVKLCKCRKCDKFFACTNTSWWGCRQCGFYDGDNTASKIYNGDEDLAKQLVEKKTK